MIVADPVHNPLNIKRALTGTLTINEDPNEERGISAGLYLAKFVFRVSRDGFLALPRGAMGLSAVCDCDISCSYSLFLYCLLRQNRYSEKQNVTFLRVFRLEKYVWYEINSNSNT